jgi:hypothetical protein
MITSRHIKIFIQISVISFIIVLFLSEEIASEGQFKEDCRQCSGSSVNIKASGTRNPLITLGLPESTYVIDDRCGSDSCIPKSGIIFRKIFSPDAMEYTSELGKPLLPLRTERILLPPDVEVVKVEIVVIKEEQVALEGKISPVQPTDILGWEGELNEDGIIEPKDSAVNSDLETYHSVVPYPANILQTYKQSQWGAFNVLNITYAPFQYIPAQNILKVIKKANIDITYRDVAEPKEYKKYASDHVLAMAKQRFLNGRKILEWYADILESGERTNPVDLVIIRPDYFLRDVPVVDTHGDRVLEPPQGIFVENAQSFWIGGYPENYEQNNMAYYHINQYQEEVYESVTLVAQENGQRAYINGVSGLANGTVVAVGWAGDRGVIFTRMPFSDPGVFTQVALPAAATGKKFYATIPVNAGNPHSAFYVIGGTADGTGNTVFKATDITNPSTWEQVAVPTTPPLRGIYVYASQAWAVGDQGAVLYYNGSSWSVQNSGVTQNLRSVAGSGADLWAVGDSGIIMYNDGFGWQDRSYTNPDRQYGFNHNLNVVRSFSSLSVWVGGEDGYFMIWNGASGRWVHQYITHGSSWTAPEFKDIAVLNGGGELFMLGSGNMPTVFHATAQLNIFDTYVSYRQDQGYRVEVQKLSNIISQYEGENLYQRIQAYLFDRYTNNGLTHVLIAGSSRLVPNDHDQRPYSGTDGLYRDIIGSDDNYELFVSRIPRDGADEIQNYLQRVIDAESRTDIWLNKALLTAGCFSPGGGLCGFTPTRAEWLKTNFFIPVGYNTVTLYEHEEEGGNPWAPCQVESTDTLSPEHVLWRWVNEHPYFVSMAHHGGPGGIENTWNADDASALDNTTASHVWAGEPCSTASPDFYDNVGSKLIWQGGISYVGAVTTVACSDPSSALQEPFFGHIIRDRQAISEAFNFSDIHSSETLFGDPLVGYAGRNSRVISFHYPCAPGAFPVPTELYRGISQMEIIGSILGPGFSNYIVEWGQGAEPLTWTSQGISLINPSQVKVAELVAVWDTSQITDMNEYSLRITALYNGQQYSHKITFTIDNLTCQDGTPAQQCSQTKPLFCESGQLIDKCSECGCPDESDTCTADGRCIQGCIDGTPAGSCSSTDGFYCSSGGGQLIDLSLSCASVDGVAHTSDDCRFCESTNGTYCEPQTGACSANQSNKGLIGDYFQGYNFNTLVTNDIIDPIMDFGGGMQVDNYFSEIINSRAQTTTAASVRWEGFIYVPTAQSITYYMNCKNGSCKLYINNLSQALISSGGLGVSAALVLNQGYYPIKVEYQRNQSVPNNGLQIGWKVEGGPYHIEFGGQTFPIPVMHIISHQNLRPSIGGGGGPKHPAYEQYGGSD